MKQDGFSLIEALVALSIMAVAGLALTHLSGETLRTAAGLERRMLAGILARNMLTEALLAGTPPRSGAHGHASLAGRDWLWNTTVTTSAAPSVSRVTVSVRSAATRRSGETVSLTGWHRETLR